MLLRWRVKAEPRFDVCYLSNTCSNFPCRRVKFNCREKNVRIKSIAISEGDWDYTDYTVGNVMGDGQV